MDFGRPLDPATVDWQLPADTELTELVLRQAGEVESPVKPALYIGSTAWGQRELLGSYYPTGTVPGKFLEAYGKQFNSIELNATFYRVPDFHQVQKWSAAVPDDFKFCPKVSKWVSQASDLGVATTRILDFVKSVQHFEHKLGPCFLQLPPTFGVDKLDVLRRFLDEWPTLFALAVEFRHPSWFENTEAALDAFAELHARGIGTVITDVGGRRDVAHMNLTTHYALIRWVGTMHQSDAQRLDDLGERLSQWLAKGLPNAYVFTHEPEAVPSARAATALENNVRKYYTLPLAARSPAVIQLAEPTTVKQPTLFA